MRASIQKAILLACVCLLLTPGLVKAQVSQIALEGRYGRASSSKKQTDFLEQQRQQEQRRQEQLEKLKMEREEQQRQARQRIVDNANRIAQANQDAADRIQDSFKKLRNEFEYKPHIQVAPEEDNRERQPNDFHGRTMKRLNESAEFYQQNPGYYGPAPGDPIPTYVRPTPGRASQGGEFSVTGRANNVDNFAPVRLPAEPAYQPPPKLMDWPAEQADAEPASAPTWHDRLSNFMDKVKAIPSGIKDKYDNFLDSMYADENAPFKAALVPFIGTAVNIDLLVRKSDQFSQELDDVK